LSRSAGKTVEIVGLGAIGRGVAEKLAGINVKMIGFDYFVLV
jgi:phosphoglycerate dehydrogenase-like enzyme